MDIPKAYSFAPFGALFSPGKSKILLKTKISPKPASTGQPNKVIPGPTKITEFF